jgi:hypothetical protein
MSIGRPPSLHGNTFFMDKAFGDTAFKQRDGIIVDNEMGPFCV